MQMHQIPQEYQKPSMTKWLNPTSDVVTVQAHTGSFDPRGRISPYMKIVWQPGEVVEVDSRYDGAIHQYHPDTVNQANMLLGGGAPQLRKVLNGQVIEPNMSMALDPMGSIREREIGEAAKAIAIKKMAEDTMLLAQARMDHAEEKKAEQKRMADETAKRVAEDEARAAARRVEDEKAAQKQRAKDKGPGATSSIPADLK